MKKMFFLLCCVALCNSINAQSIGITFKNPSSLTTCDTASFEVTLHNFSTTDFAKSELQILLPPKIKYLAGSVNIGKDSLNKNPLFIGFNIGKFEKNSTKKLTFKLYADCSILTSLNEGAVFNNVYTFRVNNNEEVVTLSDPYDILSPLPIFTEVKDAYAKGIKNDVITRKIKIENTRFGYLKSFIFEDEYQAGIIVSTSQGTPLGSTATKQRILFQSTDFQLIGNKDSYFDFGESLVIEEKIKITECGDDDKKVTSKLRIQWGCGNTICKEEDATAVIDILAKRQAPKIEMTPFGQPISDYCGQFPDIQGMKIKNVSKSDTAYNLVINVRTSFSEIAFLRNSFVLNNKGKLVALKVQKNSEIVMPCRPNGDTDAWDQVVIAKVAPLEELSLSWNYIACEECNAELTPVWGCDFSFEKSCPVGVKKFGSAKREEDYFNPLAISSIDLGGRVKNGEIFDLVYKLDMEKLLDSTGTATVKFELPCGFSWVGGAMKIGNNLAKNLNIQNAVNNTQVVTMDYDLPFSGGFEGTYQLQFNCFPCHIVNTFVTNFHSSCEPFSALEFRIGFETVKTEIAFKLKNSAECGILRCDEMDIAYDCDEITQFFNDTIPAYLTGYQEFKRSNTGLADNDDNRKADNTGTIDESLIRRDHYVVGDTAFLQLHNVVHTEEVGTSFQNVKLNLAFRWHEKDISPIYGTPTKKPLSENSFIPIDLILRIFDKSQNQHFTCPLPNVIPKYTEFKVGELNKRPSPLDDKIKALQFTYIFNENTINCLPAGFVFQDGDSISVVGKYQIAENPLLPPLGVPTINNYRFVSSASIFNSPFEPSAKYFCELLEDRLHVSGMGLLTGSPHYDITDCDSTVNNSLTFNYGPSAKYPNFFPYEFRHLVTVPFIDLEWFSPGLILNRSRVSSWVNFGESPIFDYKNIVAQANSATKTRLFLQPFQTMQDEGFHAIIENNFSSKCLEEVNENLTVEFKIEPTLRFNLPEIKQKTFDKVFDLKTNNLSINVLKSNYDSYDNTALWDIEFKNDADFSAPNPWISIKDIKNITDLKIILLPNNQQVTSKTNFYNLANIAPNETVTVRITGLNKTCDLGSLELSYGWSCRKLDSIDSKSCLNKTRTLSAKPTPGELDILLSSPRDTLKMCSESDYFTVTANSVRFGAVYQPIVSLLLPTGLSVLPKSSQIEYPLGSGTFVNIIDPKQVNTKNFGWNLAEVVANFQTTGMPGIAFSPLNKLKIRFKIETSCGFIAGKFFEVNMQGEEICGKKTNSITRAMKPIFIKGVPPVYKSVFRVDSLTLDEIDCSDTAVLNLNFFMSGVTSSKDSVFVTLPNHIGFHGFMGMDSTMKLGTIKDVKGGKKEIGFNLPNNINKNTNIFINIKTSGWTCYDTLINVRTTQFQSSFCEKTKQNCSVSAETGNHPIKIGLKSPIIKFNKVSATITGNMINLNGSLSNSGDPVDALNLGIYFDANQNQKFDAGVDIFLHGGLVFGTFKNDTTSFMSNYQNKIPDHYLCDLLLVAAANKNCACATFSIPLKVFSVQESIIKVCSNTKIDIGHPKEKDFIYYWKPSTYLSCDSCSNPSFVYNNLSNTTQSISYNSFKEKPTCRVDYKQIINVFPVCKTSISNSTVCKDESVELSVKCAKNVKWSGPNIANDTMNKQIISITKNTTYYVTITDNNFCTSRDTIDLKAGGGGKSKGSKTICRGETLQYGDKFFSKSGEFDIKYATATSCDSTFTLTLTVLDTPAVASQNYAVKEGDDLTIQLPKGFLEYIWTPSTGLSCNDCDNPSIKDIRKEYTYYTKIIGINGCKSTIRVSISVIPFCDDILIEAPSIFSPSSTDAENRTFHFINNRPGDVTIHLRVFDKWGTLVKEQTDINPSWDGTKNGDSLPSDVYLVHYEIICLDKTVAQKTIDVTLIR